MKVCIVVIVYQYYNKFIVFESNYMVTSARAYQSWHIIGSKYIRLRVSEMSESVRVITYQRIRIFQIVDVRRY